MHTLLSDCHCFPVNHETDHFSLHQDRINSLPSCIYDRGVSLCNCRATKNTNSCIMQLNNCCTQKKSQPKCQIRSKRPGAHYYFYYMSQYVECGMLQTKPHHAVPSQEVRDNFFVDIVHQSSRILVVVTSVHKELLAGILIDQRADLETTENMRAGSQLIHYVFVLDIDFIIIKALNIIFFRNLWIHNDIFRISRQQKSQPIHSICLCNASNICSFYYFYYTFDLFSHICTLLSLFLYFQIYHCILLYCSNDQIPPEDLHIAWF